MIGRRSEFSKGLSEIEFESLQKRREVINMTCIVLDICGAHKPKSRFLEGQEFNSGIWLIVASPMVEDIVSVCWGGSYDEFRFIYGVDSNITGRVCTVKCNSLRKEDIRYGRVSFNETKNIPFQDPESDGYFSLGVLSGTSGNLQRQIQAHKMSNVEFAGEVWRPIK